MNRIRDCIPKHLHRDLYYTLFESHLSYCISVWGGAAKHRISSLWAAQKHCLRVLFCDKEAYLNKFKTCVRSRPFPDQALGRTFFEREHTKPIFNKLAILTGQNLYTYHTFMEIFKILKLHTPISLYYMYNISKRKKTFLITPSVSNDFIYRSSSIWNLLIPKMKVFDYSPKISLLKSTIKKILCSVQSNGNELIWTPDDYNIRKFEPGAQ